MICTQFRMKERFWNSVVYLKLCLMLFCSILSCFTNILATSFGRKQLGVFVCLLTVTVTCNYFHVDFGHIWLYQCLSSLNERNEVSREHITKYLLVNYAGGKSKTSFFSLFFFSSWNWSSYYASQWNAYVSHSMICVINKQYNREKRTEGRLRWSYDQIINNGVFPCDHSFAK